MPWLGETKKLMGGAGGFKQPGLSSDRVQDGVVSGRRLKVIGYQIAQLDIFAAGVTGKGIQSFVTRIHAYAAGGTGYPKVETMKTLGF
jgi:hypothetical protein